MVHSLLKSPVLAPGPAHGADAREGAEADEFDVRREVGGADGFLAEQVRAEVLLVAVREHRDDRGARAERVLHLERPEEVCARRDADGEAMVRELLRHQDRVAVAHRHDAVERVELDDRRDELVRDPLNPVLTHLVARRHRR